MDTRSARTARPSGLRAIVWEPGPSAPAQNTMSPEENHFCVAGTGTEWEIGRLAEGGAGLLLLNSAQEAVRLPLFSDGVSLVTSKDQASLTPRQPWWGAVARGRKDLWPRTSASCRPLIIPSCAPGCLGLALLLMDHCGLPVSNDRHYYYLVSAGFTVVVLG
uniref:Uncharacterized protein n=1 Tax=Pipistrellus kuhlii TaxID=59472 RepID=A0A7J7VBI8_PIPKU|nr:hypothetical protein mPipKuh1_008521 [Pipistrellus kuhlii]